MVMERLEAARQHPDNQDALKQFAISHAKKLLRDAGVKDPGIKEKKPSEVLITDGDVETFVQPNKDVLSPEFANKVRNIVLQLPPDLPLGALYHWDQNKRLALISKKEHSTSGKPRFVDDLKALPDAPTEWVSFMMSLDRTQKSSLSQALSNIMGGRLGRELVLSNPITINTPLVDVASTISGETKNWGKSQHFGNFVFKDLTSGQKTDTNS